MNCSAPSSAPPTPYEVLHVSFCNHPTKHFYIFSGPYAHPVPTF